MTQPITYAAAPPAIVDRSTRTGLAVRATSARASATHTASDSSSRTLAVEQLAMPVIRASVDRSTRTGVGKALTGTSGGGTVTRPTTGLLWPPGAWSRH